VLESRQLLATPSCIFLSLTRHVATEKRESKFATVLKDHDATLRKREVNGSKAPATLLSQRAPGTE